MVLSEGMVENDILINFINYNVFLCSIIVCNDYLELSQRKFQLHRFLKETMINKNRKNTITYIHTQIFSTQS